MLALPESERRLGPFQLVQQLGKGGFAPVWLAHEVHGTTRLRTVAVKLFALEDAKMPTGPVSGSHADISKDRIVAEARALCQVEHPNVVRFYAIATDASEKVIGLVMEYVHGVSLDRRLDEARRLPMNETLTIGGAVASALAAVHQVGLVHRDIKPANITESAGIYQLIDFGIAAAETGAAPRAKERVVLDDLPLEELGTSLASTIAVSGRQSAGFTGDGEAIVLSGTLGYVDPACVATWAPATPASDLYAL